MGGIFCATAHDNVVPGVMQGLSDVEDWDCDSAGLAVLTDHQIQRRRAAGRLSFLETLLSDEPIAATTAIGHARSATHGEPSRQNAHPHASSRVAVVHTGIIENHAELRAELERDGAQFRSDTDTEVIVWLLNRELANRVPPLEALHNVSPRLKGSFAVGVICAQHDDRIYAAQRGFPLAAARSDTASWLASDPAALGRLTREFVPLADGQIAELSPGEVRIFDARLEEISPKWSRVARPRNVRESGRVVTDAAREQILELPATVARILNELEHDMTSGALERWCGPLWRAERILAIGSGTSLHAAQVGRAWLEQIAAIPVEIELSSEIKSRHSILTEGTMALLLSRSEQDQDTLEALRYLKQRNVPTVALAASASCALARESDATLGIGEAGNSSSSTFTTHLCALAAASIVIRRLKDGSPLEDAADSSIFSVPDAMTNALEVEAQCIAVARRIAETNRAVYLGRGMSHPLALMGALSLEELSDIHAEGIAGGELQYHPTAVAEIGSPVLVLAPHDETFDKAMLDVREVLARGGEPILVGDSDTAIVAKRDGLRCIAASRVDPTWSPLVLAMLLQLVAYHAAGAREWRPTEAREFKSGRIAATEG